MKKVESLNSSKFEKLEKYQIKDTSRLYGGEDPGTQIMQSDGYHWDSVKTVSDTFSSDGGVIFGNVAAEGNGGSIPLGLQKRIGSQQPRINATLKADDDFKINKVIFI